MGKDPIEKKEIDEVPNGRYYTEGLLCKTKNIEILVPLEGDYTIKVIGTGTGLYTLTYYIYDKFGNLSQMKTFKKEISLGEVHNYTISYSIK